MTDDQLEIHIQHVMDRLDARFMRSPMTQAEYDAEVKRINAWAERQYDLRPTLRVRWEG
jgi:hypothetical protein